MSSRRIAVGFIGCGLDVRGCGTRIVVRADRSLSHSTQASRYHFCLDSEDYTGFLKILVNAKLRNAIGHNDVEYNSVDQLITYIPNPKDRTKKKTEYLLEFENEAMCMFQAILKVSEYLYRLRELELMHDGKFLLWFRKEQIGRRR